MSHNLKGFSPQRAANAMPARYRVESHWDYGTCKRCLANGVKPGDIIVRIYGQGWWHDECYRAVEPGFYEGLDEKVVEHPPLPQALPFAEPPQIVADDVPF